MTREEWAARLPLIQAFVEGKTIQCRYKDYEPDPWEDTQKPLFDFDVYEYRIKPEPRVIWVMEENNGDLIAIDYEPFGDKFKKYVEVVE